jgi:hypothetical protein
VTATRRSTPTIAALVHDVVAGAPVAREAAVARLAIAGARAEAAVVQTLAHAEPRGQAALLGVLERLATPRALAVALEYLDAPDTTVAAAAVSAVRAHLGSADAEAATAALDALVALCLDLSRVEATRLAAIDALADLGDAGLGPVRGRLRSDASARIRRAAGDGTSAAATGAGAAASRLEALAAAPGDDPAIIQQVVADAGAAATLATLHELVLALGHRERAAASEADRAGWSLALGAAHRALAGRGSRLALFDLRDAIGRTPPERLGEFLAAGEAIGDGHLLEPLARAWTAGGGAEVHRRIEAAFTAIVARERLTRRHAALKTVIERWPDAAAALGVLPGRAAQPSGRRVEPRPQE